MLKIGNVCTDTTNYIPQKLYQIIKIENNNVIFQSGINEFVSILPTEIRNYMFYYYSPTNIFNHEGL